MGCVKLHGRVPARLRDPGAVTELPGPGRRPNVASSHADARPSVRVEPLLYDGPPDAAIAALRAVVADMPRAEVRHVTPGRYLYATFTSKLFQFVDDFECLVRPLGAPTGTMIDVRSASRVGYGDAGVNRKRVESVRAALARK